MDVYGCRRINEGPELDRNWIPYYFSKFDDFISF